MTRVTCQQLNHILTWATYPVNKNINAGKDLNKATRNLQRRRLQDLAELGGVGWAMWLIPAATTRKVSCDSPSFSSATTP